tara:strand:- start:627 stop:893 length:267 start_codon:yes stop_codon:yes gene_type:complete
MKNKSKVSTKARFPLIPIDNEIKRSRIKSLTGYGHNDLVIVCDNEGIVTISYFDSPEHLLVSVKDIPRIIDALIFIDTQENKFVRRDN